MHDRDAIGAIGFVEQVRRQDDRRPLAFANLAEILPQIAAGAGVEAGAWFVEQQQSRAVEHALGKFDAAPHAARERFDQIVRPIGEADGGEELVAARRQFARREAVQAAVVAEVLGDRQLLVEARRLEDDAELTANGGRFETKVVAEDRDLALLERNERRQQTEERRLAAAVRAEEGEDFALGDIEREIVDGETVAVAVGNVVGGDGGHRVNVDARGGQRKARNVVSRPTRRHSERSEESGTSFGLLDSSLRSE